MRPLVWHLGYWSGVINSIPTRCYRECRVLTTWYTCSMARKGKWVWGGRKFLLLAVPNRYVPTVTYFVPCKYICSTLRWLKSYHLPMFGTAVDVWRCPSMMTSKYQVLSMTSLPCRKFLPVCDSQTVCGNVRLSSHRLCHVMLTLPHRLSQQALSHSTWHI